MDVKFLELVESISSLDETTAIPEPIWLAASERVKDFLLCKQSYGEDRPSEDRDFTEHRSKSSVGLKCLEVFLQKLQRFSKLACNKNFVVSVLLLCGEHTAVNLWTTPQSMDTSMRCLQSLTTLCKCRAISDLLIGGSIPDMFRSVLLALRPKLLKETWRLYPAAVHCYYWSLLQVKSPYLSEHLGNVLPTALIILDDHIMTRRLVGINSVIHIIQNVTRTELCSQGWNNVLYHTLQPLLLQREPELIIPAYTCMTTLLARTEQGYTRSVAPGEWSRLESTLLTLLRNMECEDRLVLRSAYAQSLDGILQAMGPSAIQLSKKLLCIFEEYLDKVTPDTRHHALLAFDTFIHHSQVRLASNGEKITFLLLRTLYDVTKTMTECETCAENCAVLSKKAVDGGYICNDAADTCAKHQWTEDLKVIIKCLNFVKFCVPAYFDTLRDDATKKCNFNPLLAIIVQDVFSPA